jgi:hypothetical protein
MEKRDERGSIGEENGKESVQNDLKETMGNSGEDETNSNPKVIDRGWKVMPFIIGKYSII